MDLDYKDRDLPYSIVAETQNLAPFNPGMQTHPKELGSLRNHAIDDNESLSMEY